MQRRSLAVVLLALCLLGWAGRPVQTETSYIKLYAPNSSTYTYGHPPATFGDIQHMSANAPDEDPFRGLIENTMVQFSQSSDGERYALTAFSAFANTQLAVRAAGKLWKYWRWVSDACWNWRYASAKEKFEEFASRSWQPPELMDYCRMTFEYEQDPLWGLVDNMQPPWALLERKSGDCEDWANLMLQILLRQGREAYLLFVFSPTGGHSVCAFREGTTWSLISNRGLQEGFNSWDELLVSVSKNWLLAYVVVEGNKTVPIWRDASGK